MSGKCCKMFEKKTCITNEKCSDQTRSKLYMATLQAVPILVGSNSLYKCKGRCIKGKNSMTLRKFVLHETPKFLHQNKYDLTVDREAALLLALEITAKFLRTGLCKTQDHNFA